MSNTWSLPTKLIHFGVAISIGLQLLISLVMEFPDTPQKIQTTDAAFFELHEMMSIIAVVFVLVHWFWLFKASDNGFSELFPLGRPVAIR